MKKITSILFLFGLLVFSCEKDTPDDYPIEAEVLGWNSDCGSYTGKILNGLSQVQSAIGSQTGDSIYISKNLPSELETAGLKLLLDVRKPHIEELGPCTAFGPAYYWLIVEKAEKKESSAKS